MIDNILTNLLPAGLQDFFQELNVSNDDDDKQTVVVFPRLNSPLGLCLHYSVANFLVPQIQAHGDAKMLLFVVNDELAHHPVEKWSYYRTTSECLVVNNI